LQQTQGIERTMREITTINQMISTAVMQQAEMIETLYNNAVDATQVCCLRASCIAFTHLSAVLPCSK
jgi:t-SNARE complex subunit (syntaxin)